MSIIDSIKDAYNSGIRAITGETDVKCPKCGKTNLRIIDGLLGKNMFCPNCHFNYEDEIRRMGGDGGGSSPSSGLL